MTREEVKKLFGSLTVLASLCGLSPQAVSQWFDKKGCFIGDSVRRNAIIGAARLHGKTIPSEWLKDAA